MHASALARKWHTWCQWILKCVVQLATVYSPVRDIQLCTPPLWQGNGAWCQRILKCIVQLVKLHSAVSNSVWPSAGYIQLCMPLLWQGNRAWCQRILKCVVQLGKLHSAVGKIAQPSHSSQVTWCQWSEVHSPVIYPK